MRRTGRGASWVAVAVLAGGLSACSGGDDDASCRQPSYGGDATDEAWRTMVDGDDRALVGDEDAPVLTEPAEGADVSAAGTSLRVSWDSPIALAPRPRRPLRRAPAAPSWPDVLGGWLEGTAWAHLPPVTGDIYWLRLTVSGRPCRVEAVTTDRSWDVAGDDWQALQAARGESVTIEVTSAYLNENRITEGPYRGAARTVQITP